MNNTTSQKDAQFAVNDCIAGYFDKWYRYNRKDNGKAYESAWIEQNKITKNETISFIECNQI